MVLLPIRVSLSSPGCAGRYDDHNTRYCHADIWRLANTYYNYNYKCHYVSDHRQLNRLLKPLSRLCIKNTTKHRIIGLLWGESTVDRCIEPLTTDHYRGKCFHVMTSPWDTHWVSDKLASFWVLRLLVVIAIDPFIRQALVESHRRPLTSSQHLCSGCWRAYLFALKYQQKDIP